MPPKTIEMVYIIWNAISEPFVVCIRLGIHRIRWNTLAERCGTLDICDECYTCEVHGIRLMYVSLLLDFLSSLNYQSNALCLWVFITLHILCLLPSFYAYFLSIFRPQSFSPINHYERAKSEYWPNTGNLITHFIRKYVNCVNLTLTQVCRWTVTFHKQRAFSQRLFTVMACNIWVQLWFIPWKWNSRNSCILDLDYERLKSLLLRLCPSQTH